MNTLIDLLYDRDMDTRLLEYFVTVADELSVTRAAQRLYAAQSTVSAGLRSLERELGVTLFERTTKTVRLLPAGETLLPEARGVLDGLERLRGLAAESGQGLRGRVRIGTFAAMQLFDLPRILGRFQAEYPFVDIQLVASLAGSTGLAEDLARGRLDLAFSGMPAPSALDAWRLATFEFVVLVPPGHRLAGRASVSLGELSREAWVDVLPGYGNRVQLERVLAERGIARRVTAELAELPSVPSCVAAGLGVAVVPDAIDTSECVTLPIDDDLPPWTLSLVTRRGAARRPQVKALIDLLRARAGHGGFDKKRSAAGASGDASVTR